MKRLTTLLALFLAFGFLAACDTGAPSGGGGGVASPTAEGGTAPTSEPGSVIQPGTGDGSVVGDPQNGGNFETGTVGSGFIARVTGPAFSGDITGDGYFGCENGRYAIRSSNAGLQQVTLIVPPGATPGTYSFGDMSRDDEVASAMVTLADNSVFAGSVLGTLILNTIADEPGEIISGSYDFSASNGQSDLSVEGSFEFRAAQNTTFCN